VVLGFEIARVVGVCQLSETTDVVSVQEKSRHHCVTDVVLHELNHFTAVVKSVKVNDVRRVSNGIHKVSSFKAVGAIIFCEENSKIVAQHTLEIICIEGVCPSRVINPLARAAQIGSNEGISIILTAGFWFFIIPV